MYWDCLIETVEMKVSDEQYIKKENAMSHHTRVDTPFQSLALEVVFSSELNFVNFHCLHKQQKLVSNLIYVAPCLNTCHLQSFTITVVWLKPKEQRKKHNM